jgi:uncharacterized membrane protein YoaK (UPF0700 family)
MKNLGREATRDLLMLSLVAGSADATGFMAVGHVFTSNMTGNLVLLGIAVGQHQWSDVLKTLYVLMMFIIGTILGSRLVRQFPDQAWRKLMTRILIVETILLVSFALCWALISERSHIFNFYRLIPLLAIAMGVQSAGMNRLMIAGVTNTAMTGTLTNFAIGLESLFFKSSGKEPDIRQRAGKQLMVILLYCSGAVIEGVLMLHIDLLAGLVPATFISLILILHLRSIKSVTQKSWPRPEN